MHSRMRSLPIAFLVALLAGGCIKNESSESPKLSAPGPTDEVYGIVLPFDSYELSLQETYQDSSARDELIRRCLKEEGKGRDDWPALDYPSSAPDPKNRRRYGVIEEDVARKLGYHAVPGMLGSRGIVEQRQERDHSLSAEAFKLVYDEEDGCSKKASNYLLRNGGKADYSLFNQLNGETLDEARKEPEVQSASRAWSSCMAEQGLKYSDPTAAIADKRWWSDESEQPSSSEIDTAIADVGCQRKSKLIRRLYQAEKRLQLQAIAKHREYFNSLKHAKAATIANARNVLGVG